LGEEVVGEDREAVDVGEVRDAGEDQVVGGDLRALVEAAVGEERHPLGQRAGETVRGARRGGSESGYRARRRG